MKSLDELLGEGVKGRRVLVRADLNVPLDGGTITDDGRIRAVLPTLTALRDGGARVVVMSHLGRPKGAPEPKYSLAPVARRLGAAMRADDLVARWGGEEFLVFAPNVDGPELDQLAERVRLAMNQAPVVLDNGVAIVLLIVQIAFAGNFTFFRNNVFLFPAITLFAFIEVVLASSTMLALSSLSKSSRYVAILYAAVIFFTQAVYGVLYAVTRSTAAI